MTILAILAGALTGLLLGLLGSGGSIITIPALLCRLSEMLRVALASGDHLWLSAQAR